MIGWTLARYLSVRFLQTIGAVFLMISGMIYVVDFIELLRRTGDIPGISAGYIAYFSFLRVPSVSEQIMPFCVLFGTMATFLNLTARWSCSWPEPWVSQSGDFWFLLSPSRPPPKLVPWCCSIQSPRP